MKKTSIQGKLLRFMFIFLYNSAVSQSYKTTSFMENIQYKGDSITISLNYDNEGKFSNYSFKDSVYKQNFSFNSLSIKRLHFHQLNIYKKTPASS